MTSTYGVSPILKRNKQPLAARTWGRNLTPSLPPHLLSKSEMFHLLCGQAPLILPKITSKSQWLCRCLMSWDCFRTSSLTHPRAVITFSVFSFRSYGYLLLSQFSRDHISLFLIGTLFPPGGEDLWRRRGSLHNNVNNSPLSSVQKYRAVPTSCLSARQPACGSSRQFGSRKRSQTDICSSDCEAANRTAVASKAGIRITAG